MDPRLHIIAVTGIVERDGKYLILKRSEGEVAWPGYWTVPGGKVVRNEYENLPMTPNTEGWYEIIERTLEREIEEEAGIKVKDFHYLTNLTTIRPDNIPVLVLSYWCRYDSGKVLLGKDITDFAWITPKEGKNYQIIPGILDEVIEVDRIIHNR